MIMAGSPPVLLFDFLLMAMLVVVAFAVVRLRSLFAIVLLQGVYSLLSAAWFTSLDAVDVAFTEAAVGAGVSTVLMLAAMLLTEREAKPVPTARTIGPLVVVLLAGIAMFYAIGDMPAFGDPNSPANSYVGMDYVERTDAEIHIPNVVTAVLASYRGFDTFGEVIVVFAAGLGVLMLLGLNGNAGRWRAQPIGQQLYDPAAPAARVVRRPTLKSSEKSTNSTPKRASRGTAKSSAVKSGTSKTGEAKTTSATSKPAAAKPAASKSATPKKTTSKKAASSKTGSKKPQAKKAGPKS